MSQTPTPVSELGYEQCRDELLEVERVLEQGGLDLDASLKLWERGETLARRCEEHLAGARARIEDALAASKNDAEWWTLDSHCVVSVVSGELVDTVFVAVTRCLELSPAATAHPVVTDGGGVAFFGGRRDFNRLPQVVTGTHRAVPAFPGHQDQVWVALETPRGGNRIRGRKRPSGRRG
jgi:exodeoxyribonuclease VII small subunit